MSNRGAYSTKERMPSDNKRTIYNKPGRLYPIGFWRCTAFQARRGMGVLIPAHPRFTRMYGVTKSIAFQAIGFFIRIAHQAKASRKAQQAKASPYGRRPLRRS